ncbi:MAG: preprotein translocase subunit SecG [Abyssibacter sp.]|uniref:preprotein translocase subunit SecG n=1 Tax=Abyssibacter sp. TaxID=2320200 RepID=UPI00321945FC
MMYTVLVVVQVILALGIIALVFLQQGKGAEAGAAFGSGASGTVFGSRGSANFLSRATAISAALFFAVSLSLAYLVSQRHESSSVVDRVQQPLPADEAEPAVIPEPEPETTEEIPE